MFAQDEFTSLNAITKKQMLKKKRAQIEERKRQTDIAKSLHLNIAKFVFKMSNNKLKNLGVVDFSEKELEKMRKTREHEVGEAEEKADTWVRNKSRVMMAKDLKDMWNVFSNG